MLKKGIITKKIELNSNKPILITENFMQLVTNVINSCQLHKMVKHTQTIRWQYAHELFECVWTFCGVGA